MDLIKMIVDWQKEKLLDKQDFNKRVETLNILEELVEVNTGLKSKEAREKAEELYDVIGNGNEISKEEIADAFCDIIVYAVGAMLKAGIDPQCALNETLYIKKKDDGLPFINIYTFDLYYKFLIDLIEV